MSEKLVDLKNKIETSGLKRRLSLIEKMSELEAQSKDCMSCSGMCCTYEFNSMLITPLEAFELISYLAQADRIDKNLVENLSDNIKKFRLDRDFNLGHKRELRRYYTCPFFKNKSVGCSISRGAKPYGCLGFNPEESKVKKEGNCSSNFEILEQREQEFYSEELKLNKIIAQELDLQWTKKTIPVAINEFINKLVIVNS